MSTETAIETVRISEDAAEACLAVFESMELLKNGTVANELRAGLADYDTRVGRCDGTCHEANDGGNDCPRCCSGREMQVCPDCLYYGAQDS